MPTTLKTISRPSTGTTVNGAYTYNGDRQRVVRTARGVFGAQTTFRYLWSGSEILKDYHGNGNTRASYILGVGREAIKNSNDDGWRFYITDRLGSTRYMTDASGNITDSYTYTAYGAIKTSTSTRPSNGGDFATYYNPFLFTGQQYDSGEGNYYLRNRYYVPAYGRFLVADPIRYQGGMNLYAYCSGNPINCVDPFGLETEWTDSNARRDVYRGMLQGTFNWQNAQRMGLSILEAMSLVNPSQYLGEQAIDKFSENVPGGDANPLLKFGTKSGRRKALKNSLRTGLAPGQIRDFPSGYSIPDSSVLKTRKVWRQGSEISEQVREGLADQYPNADPLKWRKVFGDLEVEDYAGNREVFDIHWYDNPAVDALHSLKYKPPR